MQIRTAGSGYTLKIVALDSKGFAVGQVFTPAFAVGVGLVFNLKFSTFISSAVGGAIFNPSPTLSLVDRGGNIVTSVSGIVCSASLTLSPSGNEQLLPIQRRQTIFINGNAKFDGLYINTAGSPYQIKFNTSNSLVSLVTLFGM